MGILKELKKNKVLFLMTLPATVFLLIFNYLPMFGIIIAFKNLNYTKGILGSDWVGFKNFKFLFSTQDAFIITRNTVLYNLTFIFLGTLLTVALAIIINEMRNKFFAKSFQTIVMLPHFLSWVVVGYLAYSFLSFNLGVFNQLLNFLGVSPINWYNTSSPWPYIIVFANTWKNIGFQSIIYLAVLSGISNEYYEAAVIDGATKWQQMKSITLPMLMPTVVLLTLLAIGKIFFADFGLFYMLPRDSGVIYSVTNVIDTYVYRSLTTINNISMSSAASVYQSVVGFILILCSNLLVRKFDKEKALF